MHPLSKVFVCYRPTSSLEGCLFASPVTLFSLFYFILSRQTFQCMRWMRARGGLILCTEFFGNSLCGRCGARGAVGRGMRRLSWLLDINPKVQIKTHLQPYIIPSKIILAIQAPRESSQHTTSTCIPAAWPH